MYDTCHCNVIYFHLKTLLNIGNPFRAHNLKGKTIFQYQSSMSSGV